MTFSKYFKAVTLVTAVLVCFSSAAKVGKGKVTFRIGDSKIQKEGKESWKEIAQGMKVGQHDRIRTELEAQVIITLPDGSTIAIDEGTLIELPELMTEDGVNKFAAEIKAGRVKFDVQKQSNAKSSIKFTTGTATAAIRGTSGVFGVLKNGKAYASLHSGQLDFTVGDKTYSVGAGQTAIPGVNGYQVVDLSSSGEKEFLKDIEELMGDSTISLDSIITLAKARDSQFVEMLNSLKDSLQCSTNNLPDTTNETSVTLKAICKPGINVTINGQTIPSNGDEIQIITDWAPITEGEKRFPITCSIGKIDADCGLLKTYFKPAVADSLKKDTIPVHNMLQLTSSPVISVCEKGLATVEGTFDPSDPSAELRVSVGNVISDNLLPLYVGGKFSYSIPVNDAKGNWNEKQIKVTYVSNTFGTEVATAELSVNKSCHEVNMKEPRVSIISTDPVKCQVELKIDGAKDDEVELSYIQDGTVIKGIHFANDMKTTLKLTRGIHDYTFKVEDLGQNKSSITRKLGCFPQNDKFGINFRGAPYEKLRVPPYPPKGHPYIYRTLHITVTGISENDPAFINEINISQKNHKTFRFKGSDLQSNSVDYQVELPWGAVTTVEIEVKMNNGSIVKATKTYDTKPKSSEVKK